MTGFDKLLSSIDGSWKTFSEAWKKASEQASEKSIHNLRVSSRRLIATLELWRAVSRNADIAKLQKGFKKVLKRMGPLRDVQVQLKGLSRIPRSGVILDFKRVLERRERRRIRRIRDELHDKDRRRFNDEMKSVRTEIARLNEKLDDARMHRSLDRILKLRQNDFSKTRRRFDPSNPESLHEMRIALKKLRYTVEAAQPVLGNSADEHAREMHALQQLLGESRDVELLRTELEKWVSRKGKKIAAVPALERLGEERETLRKKIGESIGSGKISAPEVLKPAAEKTQLVAPELNSGKILLKKVSGN
jgi:CHAD domain-containing protein